MSMDSCKEEWVNNRAGQGPTDDSALIARVQVQIVTDLIPSQGMIVEYSTLPLKTAHKC